MDYLAGAKELADRVGDKPDAPRDDVSAEAPAVFHWCGVNPDPPDATPPDPVE